MRQIGPIEIHMAPFAKARPRVTRRSTYMPSSYENRRDLLRILFLEAGGEVDLEGALYLKCAFYFSMPKNWSKKRKREMAYQPCLKKPDLDNCLGAVMDAILDKDSIVYKLEGTKVWHEEDSIVIEIKVDENG